MTTEATRRIFQGLSDLFVFVRSQEANKAIAAVTAEDLIQEQVKRNGDTALSNTTKYNPYAFDFSKPPPQSQQPLDRANFLSGSDINLPTKMDRLVAIENEMDKLIQDVKNIPPDALRDFQEESDMAADSITTAAEFEERLSSIDEQLEDPDDEG
jgi:histidinol dehydrogenase